MGIDPSAGLGKLVTAWDAAYKKTGVNKLDPDRNVLECGQGYWHAGNTLDAYVTYLVYANQKDTAGIVAKSSAIFPLGPDKPEPPRVQQKIWWRDDYGWWGIALLNAAQWASILGIDDQKADLIKKAISGWQIMDDDWEAPDHRHQGVRNDPSGQNTETNTITNVLFFMLSLRLYQTADDSDPLKDKALEAARGVFDWFYPDSQNGPKRLFNQQSLIRYLPGSGERAWSADQGWFWRACLLLNQIEVLLNNNPDRKNRTAEVIAILEPAVIKKLFQDGVLKEVSGYDDNYNLDFATGPGVFMRQFTIVNNIYRGQWSDLIRTTAEAAAAYSGWDSGNPSGCWHPDPCEYKTDKAELWNLTLMTSAHDAFTAYLRVGPG